MKTIYYTRRLLLPVVTCTGVLMALLPAGAQLVSNPVVFVTQVPVQERTNTVTSIGGSHLATTAAAPRGGDLMIRYTDSVLKNLTRSAGYGEADTMQGAHSIAVRDPCIHWSGQRVLFSMVVGTAVTARWELYEVTGLGRSETPVITKVLNPPSPGQSGVLTSSVVNQIPNYNSVQPCYASDDTIIFVSDRPREGGAHLYPARDENDGGEINTGLWHLDPATGALTQLEHSPSGSFDPFVDSFGRIVFSRWDHLQRDEATTLGRFDFASEALSATGSAGVWAELYPEPLPTPANPFGLTFDQFLPWTLNQDGTNLVTINHLGRHELTPGFKLSRPDSNLRNFMPPSDSVRAGSFLQIRQDLRSASVGRYVSTDVLFTAVSAGKLLTFVAPPERAPDMGASIMVLSDHGVSRDPAMLTNGRLMASQVKQLTVPDAIRLSSYGSPKPAAPAPAPGLAPTLPLDLIPSEATPFKLVATQAPLQLNSGGPLVSVVFGTLNSNIERTVINTVRGQDQTFKGPLWELQPLEVTATARPPLSATPLEMPEIEVFSRAGVSPTALRTWMTENDLAILSCRNVTTRDAADIQQPTSLRVDGGVETIAPGDGPVYTVSALEFFQADYVRGYGLTPTDSAPDSGRRVAARTMHDDKGANPASAAGPGHVKVSPDGSMAAFVPARRGLSWQLEDPAGNAIVRERYWLSFQAGEIRSCTSCHGVNSVDQAGHTVSTNPPQALRALLDAWKQTHPEAAAGSFRIWSEAALGKTLDPAADSDGDGASNFEEFAIGSSPVARPVAGATNQPLAVTREAVGGQELNTLTFTRSTTAFGLELTVESSDDMASWTEAAYFAEATRRHAAAFALETTSASSAQVENIRLTDLSTNAARRRFYRLRLQAP